MRFIKVEYHPRIAVITINRPECLNALSTQVHTELYETLEQIEKNERIHVVILTGSGEKAFVAGADISEMVHLTPLEGCRMSELSHKSSGCLERMRQVTIAAVNGYALGGGCELAISCDLRIASENAQFGFPEVKLGIFPAGGGTQRLAQIVGMGRAKELIFTGKQISAKEAHSIGLINDVVPHWKLMETVFELAETISNNSPYAISLAKSLLNGSTYPNICNGMKQEEVAFGLAFASEDRREGMESFLENRKPVFK